MAKNDYSASFLAKYGENEIKLPHPVLTISDNKPDPFSSGSFGYLTKARINEGMLEFYHDWWAYGWMTYEEAKQKYPCPTKEAVRVLGL